MTYKVIQKMTMIMMMNMVMNIKNNINTFNQIVKNFHSIIKMQLMLNSTKINSKIDMNNKKMVIVMKEE